MLQSLVSLCNHSYSGEAWKEVDTLLWILSRIDMKKLIDRLWIAMDNPDSPTKVVLCEYNYTTRQSCEAGHPNVCDRLPNGTLVHDAMYRTEFVDLMNQAFCLNERIVWYRRRKVTREGTNDVHRMQVVLLFKEYAFLTLPAPIDLERSIAVPPPSPVLYRTITDLTPDELESLPSPISVPDSDLAWVVRNLDERFKEKINDTESVYPVTALPPSLRKFARQQNPETQYVNLNTSWTLWGWTSRPSTSQNVDSAWTTTH